MFTEDSILVVNTESGCYFMGKQLIHTDSCTCDEDYDRYADVNL